MPSSMPPLLAYFSSHASTHGVALATLTACALALVLFLTLVTLFYLADSFYRRTSSRVPRLLRVLLSFLYVSALLALALQCLYWIRTAP